MRIVLILFVLGLIVTPVCSQKNVTLNKSSVTSLGNDYSELRLTKPDIKSYAMKDPDNKLKSFDLEPGDLQIINDQLRSKRNIDNMPCIKPEFHSNMPIMKPDTTVTYKLLIKKIH